MDNKDVKRRFTNHKEHLTSKAIGAHHPASVEGKTIYTKTVKSPGEHGNGRVLKSAVHNRKIGSPVVRGKWSGMPVYTLTLEERATCPRYCMHWHDCYGNKMHFAARHNSGKTLIDALLDELAELSVKHGNGFLIRLHVLGDFWSTEYVDFWEFALNIFPQLHAFGYSSRSPFDDGIGTALFRVVRLYWDRFAIRYSNPSRLECEDGTQKLCFSDRIPAAVTVDSTEEAKELNAIRCPAQTGQSNCCATCALCWDQKKPIAFMRHGKSWT